MITLWLPDDAALLSKASRIGVDHASDRPVGGIRRKSRPCRRHMACSRSGSILSRYGNSVDHPIETIGEMGADWALQNSLAVKS